MHLTYCSNLHPIEEFEDLLDVAENFWPLLAEKIKKPEEDSGFDLGIWLSQKALSTAPQHDPKYEVLLSHLKKFNGQVLTANAFPMGNFHSESVKESVYLPDWQSEERLEYSKLVAESLSRLPCQSRRQTMSTSPGSFKAFPQVDKTLIAQNLRNMAEYLAQLEKESGRYIVLAIEPEPGCTFETTAEFIAFYDDQLLGHHGAIEAQIRRHIGICFDCCHQSIQFEDPKESLRSLRSAGIPIAKVQLSSALEIARPYENPQGLRELSAFSEDRYLHQVIAQTESGETQYFGDLPDFLKVAADRRDVSARIHFHVPIFLEEIGSLKTTQRDLKDTLQEVIDFQDCEHLEIETYSWSVMPERRGQVASPESLLKDITREYEWVQQQSEQRSW